MAVDVAWSMTRGWSTRVVDTAWWSTDVAWGPTWHRGKRMVVFNDVAWFSLSTCHGMVMVDVEWWSTWRGHWSTTTAAMVTRDGGGIDSLNVGSVLMIEKGKPYLVVFGALCCIGGVRVGVSLTPPPCCFQLVFVSYSGSFVGLGGARGGTGGYAASMSFLGCI